MIKGLDAEVTVDKGAYAALELDIIENAMVFVAGPYFIPTVRINVKSLYTHNVMSGAMRGFGANQGNFVIESLVDMATQKMGMDPFEIRLKNALKPGLPTVSDHVLEPGIAGVEEVLQKAKEVFPTESAPKVKPGTKLGVGIACGVKNLGFGHGLPESAGAKVRLNPDGICQLWVTHHEYGQGAAIGQARIASEVLGIPLEKIVVSLSDMKLMPYTGATTASRQIFLSGNATVGACRQLVSNIFEEASCKLDILDPAMLKFEGKYIVVKGSDKKLLISALETELTSEFRAFPPETVGFPENGQKSQSGQIGFSSRRIHWACAHGVQIALGSG